MVEHQRLEELKLAYGIVRGLNCLLAFESTDTDSHVSCTDHIDVICSIAYRQGSLLQISILDKQDDLCLLLGADTAGQDDIGALTQIHKHVLKRLVALDQSKRLSSHNHSILAHLLATLLLFIGDLHLVCNGADF
mgnify:CR=1 FL=1